jgi:hypothetical protein
LPVRCRQRIEGWIRSSHWITRPSAVVPATSVYRKRASTIEMLISYIYKLRHITEGRQSKDNPRAGFRTQKRIIILRLHPSSSQPTPQAGSICTLFCLLSWSSPPTSWESVEEPWQKKGKRRRGEMPLLWIEHSTSRNRIG